MENKTCKTCRDNDDGLCDRKGILIEDDDTCEEICSKYEKGKRGRRSGKRKV